MDCLIQDHFINGLPPGVPFWKATDIAADTDSDWEDAAVVFVGVQLRLRRR